ncbi:MAG: peptide deformylase [Dictyoglomus sp.]|nr:peptide deformylase [Dictyoglomus sp.]MCX7942563.1 peptide deformylase [Dictyoglomaceae bacterium]MDW8188801.1 peptide deformylase [Dictyoglomus sp.]
MVLKILTIENPILRKKAKKIERIDEEVKKLAEDMLETMKSYNGVGLAATQIGKNVRLIVVNYDEKDYIFINPEIIKKEGENIDIEGCLSIPGVEIPVKRADKILLKYQNLKGRELIMEATDLFARIIQHEIDHLDGILIIDKIEEDVKT